MPIAYVGTGPLATGTASPLTATLPTHSEGDLLVAFLYQRGTSATLPATSAPAGWSPLFLTSSRPPGTRNYITGFYKVAGAAEGNPAFTFAGGGATSNGLFGAVSAWSGVDADDPIDHGYVQLVIPTSATTVTPIPNRTIVDGAVAVVFAASEDDNNLGLLSGSEEGFTLRAGGSSYASTVAQDAALLVADKPIPSAGAVVAPTLEQTQVGPDIWTGYGTFSLRPSGVESAQPWMFYQSPASAAESTVATIDVLLEESPRIGDLILVVSSTAPATGDLPNVTIPGFTSYQVSDGNQQRIEVLYKVATGGEDAITLTRSPTTGGWVAFATVYRRVDTSDPFDTFTVGSGASGTSFVAPAITTTAANTLVVSAVAVKDDGSLVLGTAQGFVGDATGQRFASNSSTVASSSLPVAAAGSVTAPTYSTNVAGEWVGLTLALNPGGSGPIPTGNRMGGDRAIRKPPR